MRGGWALCSYSGTWQVNANTGMQAFPMPRSAGTYDMQAYWNTGIRGIAPSVVGLYRVSWNFSVEAEGANDPNAKFSVQILPQYTTNAYGATAIPDAGGGANYMHSGVHMVEIDDLQNAGVIHPAVDAFTKDVQIRADQMLVEYVSGLDSA